MGITSGMTVVRTQKMQRMMKKTKQAMIITKMSKTVMDALENTGVPKEAVVTPQRLTAAATAEKETHPAVIMNRTASMNRNSNKTIVEIHQALKY